VARADLLWDQRAALEIGGHGTAESRSISGQSSLVFEQEAIIRAIAEERRIPSERIGHR